MRKIVEHFTKKKHQFEKSSCPLAQISNCFCFNFTYVLSKLVYGNVDSNEHLDEKSLLP